MSKRGMTWKQPYEQSIALCKYVGLGHINPEYEDAFATELRARTFATPKKVDEYWHRTFNCVAKYLGFNKATRKILWEDLACGNWEHLHKTEEEEARTPDDWLDKLYWDVNYCSDRYTLDRLTRCHWIYRQYMRAATGRV